MGSTRRRTAKQQKPRPKMTFTVAEANRALVLVKRIVADVLREHSRLVDLQEALEAAEEAGSPEQCEEARLALIRTAGRLRSCVEELEEIGVELEDWSAGVVDFPCVAGGRQVCLCWQHGEDRVAHWHEMGVGVAARQPLESLPADAAYVPRQQKGHKAFR